MGARRWVREAIVRLYERRLARALVGAPIPCHVGVIMDGNRRWARATGLEDVASGHRRGADKIVDLLGWCDDAGVEVVTLFLLSTDNLRRPDLLAHPHQATLGPVLPPGREPSGMPHPPAAERRQRPARPSG